VSTPSVTRPSVAVELTEDDLAALNDYYYKYTLSGQRRDRILKAAPLVIALVWAFTVRNHPEWGVQNMARYLLYAGIGAPLIVALGWGLLWYLRPTMARVGARIGPRKRMLEPLTLTLQPEHLELRNAAGIGRVPWASVLHAGHTPEHLFILFVGPNGFIVPRRSFTSDEAFEAFAQEAERLKDAA
jgi:hypothetical protein